MLASSECSADDSQGLGLQNGTLLPGSVPISRSVDAGVQAVPDAPAASNGMEEVSPQGENISKGCKVVTAEGGDEDQWAEGAKVGVPGTVGKKQHRKDGPSDIRLSQQPQSGDAPLDLALADRPRGSVPADALPEPMPYQLATWEVILERVAAPDEQLVTALQALHGAPLVIRKISPHGSLARWSAEHPEAAVRVGDYIVEVNGGRGPRPASPPADGSAAPAALRLRVARPMEVFEVRLDKDGGTLGIDFQRPSQAQGHSELRIVEVLPRGALARHNARKAAAGNWELVILPEMNIVAVNGAQDDVRTMVRLLRECPSVLLRIRRANADVRTSALC